jgi:hypothetical protein
VKARESCPACVAGLKRGQALCPLSVKRCKMSPKSRMLRLPFYIWTVIAFVALVWVFMAPPRADVPMSIWFSRNLGYIIVLTLSEIVCFYLARGRCCDEYGWNDRLNQNAQLLVAAFALVITVVLIITQLGQTLHIERAVDPPLGTLVLELALFVVAIGGTLFGRGLSNGRLKETVVVLSTAATIACYLALAPYFWYQRQAIGARALTKSTAPSRGFENQCEHRFRLPI